MGALVLLSTVAGLANSLHFPYAAEQLTQVLRMPVDFVLFSREYAPRFSGGVGCH